MIINTAFQQADWSSTAVAPVVLARIPGPIDVRLDSTKTQRQLRTRLRGASDFLASE